MVLPWKKCPFCLLSLVKNLLMFDPSHILVVIFCLIEAKTIPILSWLRMAFISTIDRGTRQVNLAMAQDQFVTWLILHMLRVNMLEVLIDYNLSLKPKPIPYSWANLGSKWLISSTTRRDNVSQATNGTMPIRDMIDLPHALWIC